MTDEGEWLARFFEDLDYPAGVVDERGKLLFANPIALSALCDGATADCQTRDALFSLAASVAENGREWRGVLAETGDVRWTARVWPLGSRRVAFFCKPSAQRPTEIARLASALRIEPSEARLALRIAQGLTNDAIATRLGVPLSTIKTRAWGLYRKVGVRNRAQLTALVITQLSERLDDDANPRSAQTRA